MSKDDVARSHAIARRIEEACGPIDAPSRAMLEAILDDELADSASMPRAAPPNAPSWAPVKR